MVSSHRPHRFFILIFVFLLFSLGYQRRVLLFVRPKITYWLFLATTHDVVCLVSLQVGPSHTSFLGPSVHLFFRVVCSFLSDFSHLGLWECERTGTGSPPGIRWAFSNNCILDFTAAQSAAGRKSPVNS